jgi:hypothetical protein
MKSIQLKEILACPYRWLVEMPPGTRATSQPGCFYVERGRGWLDFGGGSFITSLKLSINPFTNPF